MGQPLLIGHNNYGEINDIGNEFGLLKGNEFTYRAK
jgi:hypothetical protein